MNPKKLTQKAAFVILRPCYYWRKWAPRRRPAPEDGSLAVLIQSFDGYKRSWNPAVWFAEKNLPDDLPIFFASEETPVESDRLRVLQTGRGTFLSRLHRAVLALKKQGFRYVLYLQEDMWISEPQPKSKLDALVRLMEAQRLDSLKLGKCSFWFHTWDGSDLESIRASTDTLPPGELPDRFNWFGPHRCSLSHQMTLFDIEFLLETIRVSLPALRGRAIQHEHWASGYLRHHIVSREGDGKKYRIAMWRDTPTIPYAHASDIGGLSEEGRQLLRQNGIEDLYNPDLPGEVFPSDR